MLKFMYLFFYTSFLSRFVVFSDESSPLFCMDSNFSIFFYVLMSQIIDPYSIIDLISAIYSVLWHSLGHCCRCILRKHIVELYLLHVFVVCSFHLRSSCICNPRYGLYGTWSSVFFVEVVESLAFLFLDLAYIFFLALKCKPKSSAHFSSDFEVLL